MELPGKLLLDDDERLLVDGRNHFATYIAESEMWRPRSVDLAWSDA